MNKMLGWISHHKLAALLVFVIAGELIMYAITAEWWPWEW